MMPASGWMRRRIAASAPEERAGALIRASARGDSLHQILDLAVQTLLVTSSADRAGLWLAAERCGEPGWGCVVESPPGPIPEQWRHLDISMPLLRAVLESPEPLRVEFGPDEMAPQIGPLMGMRGAIWIPLRARHRPVGLAMVGYAHSHAVLHLDLELLRTRVDEVALALAPFRDTHVKELAAEELRAQVRLSRAILCGVSSDSILPLIARAARQYTQAEFVALGRPGVSPMLVQAWEGPEEWRTSIQQEPLLHLWQRVLQEGREAELGGESLPARPGSASDQTAPALDRVIALPIEVRNRTCGVLMAGLLPSEDSVDDGTRLESYALMAASALDREAMRLERAGWAHSLGQIVEESSECLVFVDEEGRVREASHPARALLHLDSGLTEEARLEDLFAPSARNAVTEWRERVIRHDSRRVSSPECPDVPLEASLAGGAVVRLRLRSAIAACGNDAPRWLLHFEDHGSRKALLEAEGRLEVEMLGLMDSIDSGVLLLDAAGNIRFVSDRFAQIMGLEARSLLELGTINALIDSIAGRFNHPAEAAARWREHVVRGDEASWDELELVRPFRKIVERFARPLFNAGGARVGWLEVYRDITGQRMIQSKLLQTERMAALGQLVSGIAHELNNPLTSIQGYAQLLVSRRSPSDRIADARRISQEAERAGRIVKNLLLFSREAKPERRAVNLNEVIERTVALRAYELQIENIVVDLLFDTALPQVLADAAQLQQVVLNLVVNAEQAIQQGRGQGGTHGRIGIRTRRLSSDRIGMEIYDDGPGIPPEIVSRIFDPFFTTKPVGVGTGLGLSIVYGIVQEHGGEVGVESQPGYGAKLTVELPALSATTFESTREEPPARAHTVAVVPVPRIVRVASRPERILVVEDEPTVSQLIADVMSEEGHRVDTLLDSREALDRLKGNKYDLLICDLKMPHLDGAGLYRELVGCGSPLQHRLLFVTGDTMSPRSLEFLNSCGLPYLAKPFLVEELKEAVRRALAAAPAAEEAVAGAEWSRAVAGKHEFKGPNDFHCQRRFGGDARVHPGTGRVRRALPDEDGQLDRAGAQGIPPHPTVSSVSR
jgi:signal transduction histidine kinase/DNA-binding response OmpR family regulator